ncbi:MAG: tryptophan 2,3-dioxygenase [Patiriisocius sp.]|jgi:tryptophan 2,3-dioxygenase
MSKSEFASVHYSKYLQLDKILGGQELRSVQVGKPAHDEMLFIIVHQAYELWFKQLIHELDSVTDMFRDNIVDEKEAFVAVSRLQRCIEILKLLVDQVRIIETLTPLDFLDFRNYLIPASGFQSFQFRKFEVMLGLKMAKRTTYGQKDYRGPFTKEQYDELTVLEGQESMLQHVENWLERIPFLAFSEFDFLSEYKKSIDKMYALEEEAIKNTNIDEKHKNFRLDMLKSNRSYFDHVLNEDKHVDAIKEGKVKLSYKATMGALLINLYREEPILQLPYQLLSSLVEIDELITSWRQRHVQMVMKTIGMKMGTGGSSGHSYLKKTADTHGIFGDLANIATLMIPRSELPVLPPDLKKQLGFYFTTK